MKTTSQFILRGENLWRKIKTLNARHKFLTHLLPLKPTKTILLLNYPNILKLQSEKNAISGLCTARIYNLQKTKLFTQLSFRNFRNFVQNNNFDYIERFLT